MSQIPLSPMADPIGLEAGATDMNDINTFTVLRESNGRSLIRVYTVNGEVGPIRPNINALGLGKCLELTLSDTLSHKVSSYRVSNEPVRFVFESRQPFPNPPTPWPGSVPAGESWPVTWYRCRILLDTVSLQVAGNNFVFGSSRYENWTEIAHLIGALSTGSAYRAVVEGDPATGHPILRMSRNLV